MKHKKTKQISKKPENPDEVIVKDLANKIRGVQARLATREEDCGRQKCDVVIKYREEPFFVQVSHTKKSGREERKLKARGTFCISTHKFFRMPKSQGQIVSELKKIIEYY